MKKTILSIVLINLFCGFAFSQKGTQYKQMSIGVAFSNEQMPEGVYQPLLCMYDFGWNLRKAEHHAKKGAFYWYFEPQFNPVFISGNLNDLEFGLNGGFKYFHDLGAKSKFYIGIGSGPHFITVQTRMQADGYIFSDNFFTGINLPVGEKHYLNLQYRFRHISNAGFQKPNKGLDNHFLVIGLGKR